MKEELNVEVTIGQLLDTWVYNILDQVEVLIVTYACSLKEEQTADIRLSHEHKELGFFPLEEIQDLNMPEGYKKSIYSSLNP